MPKQTKKNKKTAKKTAFNDLISTLSIPMKKDWYLKTNKHYVVFSPFGEDSPCETIGIDVGTKHLGISGLAKTENRKYALWTWAGLISYPAENLHKSIDAICDILYDSDAFKWIRDVESYRIELQLRVSPKNRAMACVLRTICIMFQKITGRPVDVEFVHGEKKYYIAPLYSKASIEDPLRTQHLSGASNTEKRKRLGENDTKCLLEENGEKYMLKFLRYLEHHADQLHDLTDSYLIGRTRYEKNLKISRKKINK